MPFGNGLESPLQAGRWQRSPCPPRGNTVYAVFTFLLSDNQTMNKLHSVCICHSCEMPPKTVHVPHQVGFRAVRQSDTDPVPKLDDVSVRDGACRPPGSCDFESGQCSWINVPKEDGHDWVMANGGFHGPPTDHTTQSPQGMTSDVLPPNI